MNIVLLFILIVLSSVFSCSETAFLSVNKIKMRNLAEDGNKKAQTIEKMLSHNDHLFSAILVGNNIAISII